MKAVSASCKSGHPHSAFPALGAVPKAVKTVTVRIIACATLLVLFMWPAIYNGQPIFSPDTSAYIRGFDAGVVWLTGRTSAWTTWATELREPQEVAHSKNAGEQASLQSPSFIMAGRSVSYGALLYLGELFGGLWASIAFQAAAALAALGLTLRHFDLFSWQRFAIAATVLGLVSSLPFFTSYLLPDVFAGLALLAAANLLALGHKLNRWQRLFWFSILATAVIFHPSHLALVAVLLTSAIIARLLSIKISRVGVVALVFATGIGFVSEMVLAELVQKLLGVPISRPPVIMARMVADGPGASYLANRCPEAGLVACEFVDRLVSNSDAFLWETSSAKGIYMPASSEKRRQLATEQFRFALAVLAYDPVGQATAWANDAVQQLSMVGLSDLLSAQADESRLPRLYADRLAQSSTSTRLHVQFFSELTSFAAIISFVFVCVTMIRNWKDVSAELKLFSFVLLWAYIANAVVCGVLSGPHERYQARLTWLLPVMALLLGYERWFAWRRAHQERLPQESSTRVRGDRLPASRAT